MSKDEKTRTPSKSKRPSLGRGLNALFQEQPEDEEDVVQNDHDTYTYPKTIERAADDDIIPAKPGGAEHIDEDTPDSVLFGKNEKARTAPESFEFSGPSGNSSKEARITESDARKTGVIKILGVDQIQSGALQPRKSFDEEKLEELAASIRMHGVLQPVLVRIVEDDPIKYELIAGERRWRASQKAGLHEIPALIQDFDDTKTLEIAMIENLQREDLNILEEAHGYKLLLDDYGHTHEQLAQTLGKSRSHVTNMVRLLGLPITIQTYLQEGKLTAGHARALITADDPEVIAREVIAKGLSVRETEQLVAGPHQIKPKKAKKEKAAPAKDPDAIALEERLSDILGMRVTIDVDAKKNKNAGRLYIDFGDLNQLDEVIQRLSTAPQKL